MKKNEMEHLLSLGHQAQEKMITYLLYADAIDDYVKNHSLVKPETDNVVMRMLLESHRKVIMEIITILEETERCIGEYESDIDRKIEQLGFVHPYLEKFKKDYELNLNVLSQIIGNVE